MPTTNYPRLVSDIGGTNARFGKLKYLPITFVKSNDFKMPRLSNFGTGNHPLPSKFWLSSSQTRRFGSSLTYRR